MGVGSLAGGQWDKGISQSLPTIGIAVCPAV